MRLRLRLQASWFGADRETMKNPVAASQEGLLAWCQAELTQESTPVDAGVLSRLTIVVPSYGRQEFLLRQLAQWGASACKVIIADGSPDSLQPSAIRLVEQLPNVRYLHLPVTYAERLAIVATMLDTPYAVLLGDDEFFLKNGLVSAVRKLDSNPEIVACMGQSLHFLVDGNEIVNYATGYAHLGYELLQDRVPDRLKAAMSSHNAVTCYAVLRADTWRKSWGKIGTWASPTVVEIQQALLVHICGKVTTTDALCWLRSSENKPVLVRGEFDYRVGFSTWWNDEAYMAERKRFLESLVQCALERHDVDVETARVWITEAIQAYLALISAKGKHSRGRGNTVRVALSRFARSLLPESLVIAMKSASPFHREKGLIGSPRWLHTHPDLLPPPITSQDLPGLADVERLVSGFHAVRSREMQVAA